MTVLILFCSALKFRLHVSQLASEVKQNEPTPQFNPLLSPRPAMSEMPATPAAVAMPKSSEARAQGMVGRRERSVIGLREDRAALSFVASACSVNKG